MLKLKERTVLKLHITNTFIYHIINLLLFGKLRIKTRISVYKKMHGCHKSA